VTRVANDLLDGAELGNRIRLHALRMTSGGGSAHIGSVLSMADILGVLYAEILNVDPANPSWPERDRFILSKGHAGAGVYAALAERGFFPIEKLATHYRDGSDLSGHVSHKRIPGVELSTGSLGHGLPVGTGMAFAGLDKMRLFAPIKVNDTIQVEIEVLDKKPVPATAALSVFWSDLRDWNLGSEFYSGGAEPSLPPPSTPPIV